MKKISLFIATLAITHTSLSASLYEQLCAFNFNWKKHQDQAPEGEALHFEKDAHYVQKHLSQVIPILRNAHTNHLNFQQLASRLKLIDILDDYRIKGKFPINHHTMERTPVFIDDFGTHCAVGYLLQQSGHETVARRIAKNYQYNWLKDIHDPAIPEWQEASGFSLEELKLIQGAYDSYMPGAFFHPNKYEIPQKPEVIVAHFEEHKTRGLKEGKYVWCKGEGLNGVLHGKWEQKFGPELPWIIGYYENGQRTGKWAEYYQGTNQLCRTEHWRNDQLNGVRTRFDREGTIIEEIMFKDGKAVVKTNYDHSHNIKWVRKPIDSASVQTEVYTMDGGLLASGIEKIHNPGNLLWFQNIELTALNSASITTQDMVANGSPDGGYGSLSGSDIHHPLNLYNSPPLVSYKKEGDWVFYKQWNGSVAASSQLSMKNRLIRDFAFYGQDMAHGLHHLEDYPQSHSYDSIHVAYSNDYIQDFWGYAMDEKDHIVLSYHDHEDRIHPQLTELVGNGIHREWRPRLLSDPFKLRAPVKHIGRYNQENNRVGTWRYYNEDGQLSHEATYHLPYKEDSKLLGMKN